jgi:predicted nucleic acid-binding protein
MPEALLDTSVVIAAKGADERSLPESAAISVVTVGELHAGVLLARSAEVRATRQAHLTAVREVATPIPVDEQVAAHYGELLALARSAGKTAKATDLLIAATAAATGRALYTLDSQQASLARAGGLDVRAIR